MTLGVEIKDDDSDLRARVTKYGQLVTAPLAFSNPVAKSLDVINTAFNFVEPQPGQSIIITDILTSADKNVSATDPANVIIYESDGIASLTNLRTLVQPQLIKSGNYLAIGLNLIVGEGRWINATTDDNNILLTILYYYVPAPRSI